jgi:hypothetical protein
MRTGTKLAKRIHVISQPLARGESLLLAPSHRLVRWPDLAYPPEVGAVYQGKTITVTSEADETIRQVLLCADPLERCDAAKALPLYVLAQVYSYPQAKNMLRVADSLCAEVRRRYLNFPVSLRRLFYVAYGQSPAEQMDRWNQSVGPAVRVAEDVPAPISLSRMTYSAERGVRALVTVRAPLVLECDAAVLAELLGERPPHPRGKPGPGWASFARAVSQLPHRLHVERPRRSSAAGPQTGPRPRPLTPAGRSQVRRLRCGF